MKEKNKENQIIARLIFSTNPKIKLLKILQIIDEKDFTVYPKVFKIVKNSILKNEDVIEKLKEEKIKVGEFTDNVLFDRELILIAKELHKLNTTSRLKLLLSRTATLLSPEKLKEIIASFQDSFLKITSQAKEEKNDIKSLILEYNKEQERHSEKIKEGKQFLGIATGFGQLDTITDGIQPEHFWVVGGQPSAGKTFFVLNIINAVLAQKRKVVFYSLEMSKLDIVGRLISIATGVNSTIILKGLVKDEYLDGIDEAKNTLYKSSLKVYSTVREFEKIKLSILEENMLNKPDLIVIDYLQLIISLGSEYDTQREVAISLQELAKKIKTPIVLISQLNQDAIKNPNSSSIGYKGGGDIEASADVGIVLKYTETKEERHEKSNQNQPLETKIIIEKNRHGRTGFFTCKFYGASGKFL